MNSVKCIRRLLTTKHTGYFERLKCQNYIEPSPILNHYYSVQCSRPSTSSSTTNQGIVYKDVVNRERLRNRRLTEDQSVFDQNAWDHYELTDNQRAEIQLKIDRNSAEKLSADSRSWLEENAAKNWDSFYGNHKASFKNRQWLTMEFKEELAPPPKLTRNKQLRVLEVGCGTGSSVLPLLEAHKQTDSIFIHCFDFSTNAVNIVKNQPWYDPERCHAFQWDISEPSVTTTTTTTTTPCHHVGDIESGSLDVILMIFVLSAISPEKFPQVVRNLSQLLRPGGKILFRDYARQDMVQTRIAPGSIWSGNCIADNFYRRGDGTRVYFLDQAELDCLFVGHESAKSAAGVGRFRREMNFVDRKLIVNRKTGVTMCRAWLQAIYTKI